MHQFEKFIVLIFTALFSTIILGSCSQKDKKTIGKSLMPKTIMYNPDTTAYQELFNEEKDSVVFNSGFVTLLPDQAGDIHSTKSNEEMIVTLSGTGKIKISNGNNLDIQYGNVAHIPANTEHQVLNTGTIDLKYIYITTKSK